jgi:hypothetical protein
MGDQARLLDAVEVLSASPSTSSSSLVPLPGPPLGGPTYTTRKRAPKTCQGGCHRYASDCKNSYTAEDRFTIFKGFNWCPTKYINGHPEEARRLRDIKNKEKEVIGREIMKEGAKAAIAKENFNSLSTLSLGVEGGNGFCENGSLHSHCSIWMPTITINLHVYFVPLEQEHKSTSLQFWRTRPFCVNIVNDQYLPAHPGSFSSINKNHFVPSPSFG